MLIRALIALISEKAKKKLQIIVQQILFFCTFMRKKDALFDKVFNLETQKNLKKELLGTVNPNLEAQKVETAKLRKEMPSKGSEWMAKELQIRLQFMVMSICVSFFSKVMHVCSLISARTTC